MQVGYFSSTGVRRGRQFRFAALVATLITVNLWLTSRLAAQLTAGTPITVLESGFAALACWAALAATIALWRRPMSANIQTMTTPALRQALATHHAGHAVAAYMDDPNRIRRIDMAAPCNLHTSPVPSVTQSALRLRITDALAGMTAEEVFAGESGSHSAADLASATEIAIDMVGRYGMAGSLVSLGANRQARGKFANRVLDDPRTRKELEALIRESKRESVRSMLEARHAVIAIRDALMRETRLDGPRVRTLIARADEARETSDKVLVDLHVVASR